MPTRMATYCFCGCQRRLRMPGKRADARRGGHVAETMAALRAHAALPGVSQERLDELDRYIDIGERVRVWFLNSCHGEAETRDFTAPELADFLDRGVSLAIAFRSHMVVDAMVADALYGNSQPYPRSGH